MCYTVSCKDYLLTTHFKNCVKYRNRWRSNIENKSGLLFFWDMVYIQTSNPAFIHFTGPEAAARASGIHFSLVLAPSQSHQLFLHATYTQDTPASPAGRFSEPFDGLFWFRQSHRVPYPLKLVGLSYVATVNIIVPGKTALVRITHW